MRLFHAAALCVLVVTSACFAADGQIRVPAAPVVPQPMPAPIPPSPDAAIRLVGDQLFVIDTDVPVRVLASPRGLVKVTFELTPLKIRGQFVDGVPGKSETRTFSGKKGAFVVEAIGTGRVELLIVPEGPAEVNDVDVIRRTLDVDAGQGPIPPPRPPEPKPVDPPAPAKSLRVFLIFESGDSLTPAQRGVLFGRAVEDWLNANCTGGSAGWRRRDKDSPGEADPTMAAMWAEVQPRVTNVPCLAVERNGKVELINVEATPAKMVDVLNSYKAGK